MNAMQRYARTCLALIILLSNAGCMQALVTSLFKGGEMVGADYNAKVVVSYRPESGTATGEEFSLVETPKGLAMLLRDQKSKSGILFRTHWRDSLGDHFAAFVEGSGKQGPKI
jgi:hypothetical protein